MFVSTEAWMQNPFENTYIISQNHAQFPDVVLRIDGAQPVYWEKKQTHYESRYEVKMISQVWILQINYSYLYFLHVVNYW